MVNWSEFTTGCAKGVLLVLNGLCIVLAACVFGFAVVDTRILKQYGEEHAAGTFAGDMIIIAASILLVAIAIFGCVGIMRNSVKMLYLINNKVMTLIDVLRERPRPSWPIINLIHPKENNTQIRYVGFIMIIVILEFMIAIFVAIQRYGLEFKVTEWMREDFFRNTTADERELHKKLWDDLQSEYECCGLNGPDDYKVLCEDIRMACCPRAYRAKTPFVQKQLYKICIESATYYNSGCEDEILLMLRSDADALLGAAVLSFWFEAASLLLALWIANNLKNSVHVYKTTVRY